MLIEWMIVLCALSGFCIALYIYLHKRRRKEAPLVCPIGHTCDSVIHSRYARVLGMEVTLLGMAYYGMIAGAYKLMIYEFILPAIVYQLLVFASISGFLFSLYLLSIQAFVLKNWCSWCVISAALTTVILVLSYVRL